MYKKKDQENIAKLYENFSIDNFGSHPDRPKAIKFDNKEDYNNHMGFDANLPENLEIPKEQELKVNELIQKGYVVSGHSKIPEEYYGSNKVEIMMTLRSKMGSKYVDVFPDGKTN